MNNIALIAPIESDKTCINIVKNIVKTPRFFETEAIRCFKSWRENGGWLKDIPIYTLCSTGNGISDNTKKEFEKLGVTYIEEYANETENYSSGFLTLPYCGYYFQEMSPIPEQITIRIDLDMVLLRPLDNDLFSNIENETIIGQYDKDSLKDQRNNFNDVLPFDTGFMITHRDNNFYHNWYNYCNSDEVLKSNKWNEIQKIMGDYYLEEFAVDYMYSLNKFQIKPIQKYQFGEGYASIDTFSDEQLKRLYFRHEHIYKNNKFPWGYDSVRERLKYINRIKYV